MTKIDNISNGLKTYSGRDACIRLVSYFSLFLYGAFNLIEKNEKHLAANNIVFQFLFKHVMPIQSLPSLTKSFHTIAKQFSNTRLVMRFFDDIPAINNLVMHFKAKSDEKVSLEKKTNFLLLLLFAFYFNF